MAAKMYAIDLKVKFIIEFSVWAIIILIKLIN